MNTRTITLLIFLLLNGRTTFCQSSYTSIKFFGLSLHPYGDENAHLMPLNPDKKGYLVVNLGAHLPMSARLGKVNTQLKPYKPCMQIAQPRQGVLAILEYGPLFSLFTNIS